MTTDPLMAVIDRDGYEYLEVQQPEYLQAVNQELQAGNTPDEIRRKVLRLAGPDRQALAMRCCQAARHMSRMAVDA